MSTGAMDTQARLTADNAQFDAAWVKSADKADAASRAITNATKRNSEAQALAAKFAGDVVGEQAMRMLAAQKSLTAASSDYRRVQAVLRNGYLGEAEGSQAAAAALQRLTAARMEAAAASHAQQMAGSAGGGMHGFTQQAAASAAVRFGLGQDSIRGVERFVTSIPGAGAALMALFPIIGAAGLTGMLVNMGDKGYEALQKIRNATAATRDAFQDTHDKAAVTIDDLESENQKIQDQIDKLSGRPNNGLADALLEAKKMADQLVVSLQEDRKQLDALLKDHDTGWLGGVLSSIGMGAASTGTQANQMRGDQSALTTALRNAAVERDAATAGITDPKKLKSANDAYVSAVHEAYQKQIDAYSAESARLSKTQADTNASAMEAYRLNAGEVAMPAMVDNSQKIEDVEGRRKQLQDAQRMADLQASLYQKNVTLGGLKGNKEGAADANKAAEQKLKAYEAELAEMKTASNVSAMAEYEYWQARIHSFQAGSEEYNAIVEKEAGIAKAAAERAHRAITTASSGDTLGAMDFLTGHKEAKPDEGAQAMRAGAEAMTKMMDNVSRARDEAASSSIDQEAAKTRIDAMMKEIQINEAAGRSISKLDALRQTAALHQQAFAEQLAALDAKRNIVERASGITPVERQRQLDQIDQQRVQMQGQQQETSQRDQAALTLPPSSAVVGAKDALNDFTDAARDNATLMRDFVSSSLNKLNSSLVELMTSNHRFGWHQNPLRAAGADIAKSATGSLLKRAEGGVLGALGLGKKEMGSKANPMWVRSADSSASSASSGLLSNIFKSGSSGDDDSSGGGSSSSGGGAGSIFSSLLKFIPGFAGGVDDFAGGAAWVGEKGPELLNLPRGSSVTPMSKVNAAGGGFHHHGDVHVDARGSSNPAAIHQAVFEGYKAAVAHSMQGMQHAQMENTRRTPGLVRR